MRTLAKDILTAAVMGLVVPGIVLSIAARQTGNSAGDDAGNDGAHRTTHGSRRLCGFLCWSGRRTARFPRWIWTATSSGWCWRKCRYPLRRKHWKPSRWLARTYARRRGRPAASMETAPYGTRRACCQGYIGDEDYLSQGGTEKGLEKARAAVAATSGWVLTYEGELIEATYFSCSGGSTEDAAAVWGTEFPYLQAVASPGEKKAAHYTDTVRFSAEAFQDALGVKLSGSREAGSGT